MAPTPLTVVVPTLDEESNLAACLASVAWADERIVVDAGSRDRTLEVAREGGARVVVRPFTGYGDQRNHGAALARHDWVLCLDADERVTEPLQAEIQSLLAATPPRDAYRLRRETRFAGRLIRHCGWDRDRVLRLYDRRRGTWDARLVHERVRTGGAVGDLASPLRHETYRDLVHYAGKSLTYAERGARELARGGHRAGLGAILLLPAARFFKMYVLRLGFLDGLPGFTLCAVAAFGVFLKYARLRELGPAADGAAEPVAPTESPRWH